MARKFNYFYSCKSSKIGAKIQICQKIKFVKIEFLDKKLKNKWSSLRLQCCKNETFSGDFHPLWSKVYFAVSFQMGTFPLQEPLSTVVIKAEPLVPEPMDFPWINQNYRGQNYQFLYSLGKELLHPNKVIKVTTLF